MTKVDNAAPIVPPGKVRCAGCGRVEGRPHPSRCACGLDGAWLYSVPEAPAAPLELPTLAEIRAAPVRRIPTGEPELDTLLGGGWCAGESVLIHGPRGSGKTRSALRWGSFRARSLVAETEMPLELLADTARSSGARADRLIPTDALDRLEELLRGLRVDALILDSASRSPDPVGIVRALSKLAPRLGVVVFLIAHENKRGQASGSTELQHDPDAVVRISRPRNGWARAEITKRRRCPLGRAQVRILAEDAPRAPAPAPPRRRKGPARPSHLRPVP